MGGIMLKELEMCVDMVRLGLEFVVLFTQAVKTVVHQSLDANDNNLDYDYQVPFPYPGLLP
ncbi:hypothetical protein BVRB_7g168120 [Beta vulgaris subsp. vulgaris]|uniref:Uncharacterized protein n=1 Tax=Beta vulgaris subsp. vulgaris TaxID=3555 RepID=A0A0J8ER83_BETVV|nr:hypothetical protein BVRB_7g168120 [Beta vulgaris subsp. vulgaris]